VAWSRPRYCGNRACGSVEVQVNGVFGTFMDEGLQLLQDGMNPVAIERAAWKVGMPVACRSRRVMSNATAGADARTPPG
jgi:hypothetical protein